MIRICLKMDGALAIAAICLLMVSCTARSDPDNALIETIENNLLPSLILEGQEVEGMNIYDRMEYYQIPGVSIAFLNGGEIEWAKGYGYTSTDRKNAVDEFTLFQAASISKPVAALAALKLVEEGKIDLDENVNQYLLEWQVEENEYTEKEKVTLRRLLSHSAGLTVHGFGGYAFNDEVPTIIQVLDGEEPANSARIYPDTIPGSIQRYSGGGYTVMQKMMTDISGKEFPQLMDEYVLSRIGMESSTYQQPLPEDLQENVAWGHRGNGALIEGEWHTYPEMAAAGLWTTPTDLLKYAAEVQLSYAGESNLVLSQEMAEEMLTPQMNQQGLGPGLGGSGEQITFGHGGANEGFRCNVYAFTKHGQGVAIMTNGDRGGDLMSEILRSFSSEYNWERYKPTVKSIAALSEEELEVLAGQYMINIRGNEMSVEILVLEDHLKGIQLWDDFEFEMYPESATKFFNKEDGAQFEFGMEKDGAVSTLTVYQGGGEFIFSKN